MPIAYAERKKRRQELLNKLAPELRDRLALRHVEAVAKLPQSAQQTLAEALTARLRNIPDAIMFLMEHPQASVEDVLRACENGRQGERLSPAPSTALSWSAADADPGVLTELADLLQDCFPGMPGMTARALAADELLFDVLALVRAQQACFRSKSIQSELVFVALCGLALRFVDELNRLMDSRPHYRGALEQSGILVKWSRVASDAHSRVVE
jgi:hypothetical protein